MVIRRVYAEKKERFNIEGESLLADIRENLEIPGLEKVRILNRYDLAGLKDNEYEQAVKNVLSEPNTDNVYHEDFILSEGETAFGLEYLPGQYDQRADSAAQCIQLLTEGEKPQVQSAKVIVLKGKITQEELEKIKQYIINPVDSREASLAKLTTIGISGDMPEDVEIIQGFITMDKDVLEEFRLEQGLAMSDEDLLFCQKYFADEKRDPTITEIKVIDTYWSDHCRHTTFMTVIDTIEFDEDKYVAPVKSAYEDYLAGRAYVYEGKDKPICLMDIAVLGMKELKKKGILDNLDESEEINACSIRVKGEIDGKEEDWLVMFKNETHNHPTEIEPFGGAATCLGGAIRDPLSGRSYVYQAMRVTGSGDPRVKISETLPGKLPQRKISTLAANGYSSYGNQIGLATGQVEEIYHPGFIAKRMEIGAVIAAAPYGNVIRKRPEEGDLIILVGGRTGRDGCGGATGSSKEHTEDSILSCGAEVQKGNPPTERKIQRLFRNKEVSTLIKKCNDFGAGGVSVAIGELTEGLIINLDAVPKKYEGLDGTELAISESQERMAVVVDKASADKFIQLSEKENLEATVVAEVTSDRRLKMFWRDKAIVDINRDFLDTNGVRQYTEVKVTGPEERCFFEAQNLELTEENWKEAWLEKLTDLNVCSKKGMVEKFDSTIGAGTVLMPFGGKYQGTPTDGMAAKLPVLQGNTNTVTIMTYGYNPYLASWSPFYGGMYAVVESVVKAVALGADYRDIRLTLQEYFEKLGTEKERWGKPFSALLGAYKAQKGLGIAAIGGKDSMSGTFKDMNVPPTLVSFTCAPGKADQVISQEFKKVGSKVIYIPCPKNEDLTVDFALLKKNLAVVHAAIKEGKALAAAAVKGGGLIETLSKMCFGNRLGLEIYLDKKYLGVPDIGGMVLEIEGEIEGVDYLEVGYTLEEQVIKLLGEELFLGQAYKIWGEPLEEVFPTKARTKPEPAEQVSFGVRSTKKPGSSIVKPRVFIPVFPGTNCEYDSARAFEKVGGIAETLVFKNLRPQDIEESINEMAKKIKESQIIMIPGGFSAGDEPEGSGKFIAAVFRNPIIKEAVTDLLENRDGLMLGICNGFQALIKLGLLPYGEIRDLAPEAPTLTFNSINRHISTYVNTRISSIMSPWLSEVELGDIHKIPLSHGEGRFVASEEVINELINNGQIATQYVDYLGVASNLPEFNPNGSICAIEGITSKDGRIFGKMGHSERTGEQIAKNILGDKDQKIFLAGIKYFG